MLLGGEFLSLFSVKEKVEIARAGTISGNQFVEIPSVELEFGNQIS